MALWHMQLNIKQKHQEMCLLKQKTVRQAQHKEASIA